MIAHILDLVHFLNSWTSSVGNGLERPKMPHGADKNLYQMARYLLELNQYYQSLSQMQHWLRVVCLNVQHREKEEEDLYFSKARNFNVELELLALDRLKKRLHEIDVFMLFALIMMAKSFGIFCLLFLMSMEAFAVSFYLTSAVVYQSPLTCRDQERHERILALSFQKIHAQLQENHPREDFTYLKLRSVQCDTDQVVAKMEDGTKIIHGNDANGEGFLEIIYPPELILSEDEQANRRGDFLAVLFCNKYLLNIPEHHHADFWCPTSQAFCFPYDRPEAPFHGMSVEHRIACRMLYHFVHLGLEISLNGEVLTKQQLKQERWAEVLFASTDTNASKDVVGCARQLHH